MPNLNRVLLMGNLTRDPELRYTPNNTPVAQIGVAVNRRWRNQQSNEWQEETTFVDCEAWGRTAETINQYLRKGRPIYIEGRLKLDQWQDKDGNNRSKIKVVIENFQFLDSRPAGEGGEGAGSAPQGARPAYRSNAPRQGGAAPQGAPNDASAASASAPGAGASGGSGPDNPPPMGEEEIPF